MKFASYKVLALLLIVFISVSFSGCKKTGQSDSSNKLIKVAFSPGDMANESQAFSAKMFQKHAAEYGFEVIILDGKGDAQVQAQTVYNAIAQGVKAIFINPNDINAIIPSLKKARQAGLIVGMFSSDVPPGQEDARDFFVGVNDTMAGETAAKVFMNQFPNGANIVEIGGQSGHDAQIKRHDGFNTGIKGSNINVIDYKATQQWSTEQAMAIMEDMFVKEGDNIQGVFCHWDNGATGIIGVLKARGKGDIFIVAVDGNRAGFEQVRSGDQAVTIMQNFEKFAELSLKFAKTKMEGGNVEAVNFIPLDIVSKKNIDNFTAPEW